VSPPLVFGQDMKSVIAVMEKVSVEEPGKVDLKLQNSLPRQVKFCPKFNKTFIMKLLQTQIFA